MKQSEVRKARSTSRYQRFRKRILHIEPLCRPCRSNGLTVGAEEIDHIVPVYRAPDRFWDTGNVQPICRSCHESKTAEENRTSESPEHKAWRRHLESEE